MGIIEQLNHLSKVLKRWGQRQRGVQRLLGAISDPVEADRWIFVVGCYNSGTTLLERILASHPRISHLPQEGTSLTDALPRPEEYGWTRMWHRCVEEMVLRPGPEGRRLADRAKSQWARVFSGDEPNRLEKSVPNTVRMPFLQEYFAPAYFICIVRNGYAVAEGIRRKSRPGAWGNDDWSGGWPIRMCARQWCASDQVVERDQDQIDNFIEVRYEDLTEEPGAVVKRITNFLDLEPIPPNRVHREWTIHGVRSAITNMNAGSFERLTRREALEVSRVAGQTLEKYDYDFPFDDE